MILGWNGRRRVFSGRRFAERRTVERNRGQCGLWWETARESVSNVCSEMLLRRQFAIICSIEIVSLSLAK